MRMRTLAILFVATAARASTLAGDTGGRPGMSLYKPGEAVPLVFTATGAAGQTLTLTTQDAEGAVVDKRTLQVSGNNWTGTTNGYNARLGFYRVYGKLDDGTTIAPIGSRNVLPPGTPSFITYAIVPDPAQRIPSLPEDQAFFGMQGGFNSNAGTDILAFLGVRWTLDGQWAWTRMAPYPNQRDVYAPDPGAGNWATNGASPWQVYTIPNFTKDGRPYGGTPDVYKPGTFIYNTGALDPTYYPDWQDFVAHDVKEWPKVYPNRTRRYYEVTWEPIKPWGYMGSTDDIIKLYQLAASAMKAADPNALVMGPTMGIDMFEYFDAGLCQSLDVYSAHPYMENDAGYDVGHFDPEKGGQPSMIATLKRKLKQYCGKQPPLIGTEQGYRTRQDPSNEIWQARRLIRSNLIMLGEGWRMNTAFYVADSPIGDNWDGKTYWDWGFFYNLAPADFGGYGPGKISPKPVAAAYAAMTFLVEGRRAVNNVNWLADTTRGYVYESYSNPNDEMLVLWDFGDSPRTVTVDTGAPSVDVFDWMGNRQTMTTVGGKLTLTLTGEPTYVEGVAANLWGASRTASNVALGKAVTTSGDAGADSAGALAVDGDPWAQESRWVSTSDGNAKWLAIDLGAPRAIDEIRFYTGSYDRASNTNFYKSPLGDFHLQRWNGSDWVDIVHRSGDPRAVVEEVFAPVTTSKVRLYVDAGVVQQVKLFEIEVLSGSASKPPASGPFAGKPFTLPGTIRAVDFDDGGEGVAYHLAQPGAAPPTPYRDTPAGIKACSDDGGGYCLGWDFPGDWFRYSVDVAAAGRYAVNARVATANQGVRFHIEADGHDVSGPIAVPYTGDWNTKWTTVSASVELPAGAHALTVVLDTGGTDLNWFQFTVEDTGSQPPPTTQAGGCQLGGARRPAGAGALVLLIACARLFRRRRR